MATQALTSTINIPFFTDPPQRAHFTPLTETILMREHTAMLETIARCRAIIAQATPAPLPQPTR
jgi:hypothetical protein